MENQNKLNDLVNEGFKPLNEEDEKSISGGITVSLFNCPDGQCWSHQHNGCVDIRGRGGSGGCGEYREAPTEG